MQQRRRTGTRHPNITLIHIKRLNFGTASPERAGAGHT